MKILIFGNHLVKQDNLPLRILPQLKQKFQKNTTKSTTSREATCRELLVPSANIEFKYLDSTENLQQETDQNGNLTILDTAINISEIKILTLQTQDDFKKLQLPKSLTMHDFDLAYNLRLLKKVKLINEVKIICLPMNMKEEEAIEKITKIINTPHQ